MRVINVVLPRLVAAGCVALWLAGCADSSSREAAERPKFEVDNGQAESPPAPAIPADPTGAPNVSPAPPSAIAGQGSPGSPPLGAPPKPQAVAADQFSPYQIPNGTPEQLLELIDDLRQRQPLGQTRDAQVEDFLNLRTAIIQAADKLLSQKTEPNIRIAAAQYKLGALQEMGELGVPGVAKRLNDFIDQLTKDDLADVAQLGRLMKFGMAVDQFAQSQPESAEPLVQQIKGLLKTDGDTATTLQLVLQSSQILERLGFADDAIQCYLLAAEHFEKSEEEPVRLAAAGARDRAAILRIGLDEKLDAALRKREDAKPALVAAVKELLAHPNPSPGLFRATQNAAMLMELFEDHPTSQQLFEIIQAAYKNHENAELAQVAEQSVANAARRRGLVGQPLQVTGVTLAGEPFDSAAYKGKVVLVDFWATWCGPCLEELPNIKSNYEKWREKGFEVVGVNIDEDQQRLDDFFRLQKLPWITVISPDSEARGFKTPLAVACGVESIPFVVLIGKDGKVDSIHVRGPRLGERLETLLGEGAVQSSRKPDAPAATKGARIERPTGEHFVAFFAEDPPATAEPETNPYLARPGLTTPQLIDYVLRMLDKPKTIQGRPGFREAICEACDRVLKGEATDVQFAVAAETKLAVLHQGASLGDDKADQQLAAAVAQLQDDRRPRVQKQVAFFTRERRVLDAAQGPLESVPPLLAELKEYFAGESLAARHLRLASSTVVLINRLEDGDDREKHFEEFGNLFAKSSDKELARYGKKLAKKPAVRESDLVGKPLELAGVTAQDQPFRWDAYRGKVVIIDFWATWCGPCLREMPKLQALRERLNGQGLEVVGVNLDADPEALATFLEGNPLPWETLAGEATQDLAQKYGVRGIPLLLLVDREGKIVAVSHSVASLAAPAEKLLADKPAAGG